jgi:hypothetical protein
MCVDEHRAVGFKAIEQVFPARKRFDIAAVFLKGGIRPYLILLREMVVERFAGESRDASLFMPSDNVDQ